MGVSGDNVASVGDCSTSSSTSGASNWSGFNAALGRASAAACLCSLATGWTFGIWGGLTAMPAFAATFFPSSTASSGSGSSSSGGSGAAYCMFEDPLLSLGNSIIYLTALPALAAAARLTHARGRKPTMRGIAALQIAGAAAGAAAPNLASVFVSRALLGAAMGCSFQAPTMLLSEVLPRHLRGAGMYTYNLFMLLGFLISAVANQALHALPWGWRLSVGLMAAPGLALAALLPWVAESPQAMLQRGDEAGAERALVTLRPPGSDVSSELSQIRAAAARAAALAGGRQRAKAMLRDHHPELAASVLYPLVLILTGLTVLSSWTPNLLLALGADPGFALKGNTIMMAAGLAAAIPTVIVVERTGRRTLLAAGGAVITASMAILAALLAVYLPASSDSTHAPGQPPQQQRQPPAALLPVAVVLLCINRIAMSITLQPLAATVPAEVQPLQLRSDFSSLTTGVRNLSGFFVTQFALPLLCAAHWGLFLVFGGCAAVGSLALWLLVPETRGLPLEEVYHSWHDHWLWGRHRCVRERARVDAAVPGTLEAGKGSDTV